MGLSSPCRTHYFMHHSLFFYMLLNQLKFINVHTLSHFFVHLFFYSYIIRLSYTLYHYHWYFILLHHTQSCFFVQIANVHFHHQDVSYYIVTHVMMITTIHLCHHHQLSHQVIQQNIIQLTKPQLMNSQYVIYKKTKNIQCK